jgi:hypothetical protein
MTALPVSRQQPRRPAWQSSYAVRYGKNTLDIRPPDEARDRMAQWWRDAAALAQRLVDVAAPEPHSSRRANREDSRMGTGSEARGLSSHARRASRNITVRASGEPVKSCRGSGRRVALRSIVTNTVHQLTGAIGEVLSKLDAVIQVTSGTSAFVNSLGWELPPGVDDIGLTAVDLTDVLQKIRVVADSSSEELNAEILMASRIAELGLAIGIASIASHNSQSLSALFSGFGHYLDRTNIQRSCLAGYSTCFW